MKRIICILLSLLCLPLAFTLAACGNGESEVTTAPRSGEATTASPAADDLPDDLNFGGLTIRFALAEAQNGNFSERSLGVDDHEKDIVDSAVYARNMAISRRLGLEIEISKITGYNSFTETVSNSLGAGDDVYDVLMGYQFFDIALASAGYLSDMSSGGESGRTYINTDKEYWPGEYISAMNYKDRLYWVTGDISLRYTSGIYCTFVNKTMYSETAYAGNGSIFKIVGDGNWDFEKMSLLCRGAYSDLNSDSVCNEGDRIGLLIEKGNSSTKTALAVGAGVTWSENEADGNVKLTFNSQNERLISVIQKLNTVYNNSDYVFTPANSDDAGAMSLFASGAALMTVSKLYNAETYLRDMTDDYYVIPVPKLDPSQEGYRTLLHDGVNLFGIAYTSPNKAAAEALLEAMASENYRSVVPVYYDVALKSKYTNDPDSANMIDEIRRGVYIDFVLAWDKSITSNWLRGSISDSPTSALKRFETSWQSKLDSLIDKLDKENK